MKKKILVLSMLLISAATISAQIVPVSTFWDAKKTRPKAKYSVNKQTNEKVGSYKEWSAAGNLLTVSTYKKGQLDGKYTAYFDKPGLHVYQIGNYKMGYLDGWLEEYANDCDDARPCYYLKEKEKWKDDKTTGDKIIFHREKIKGIWDTAQVVQIIGDIKRTKYYQEYSEGKFTEDEEFRNRETGESTSKLVTRTKDGKQVRYEEKREDSAGSYSKLVETTENGDTLNYQERIYSGGIQLYEKVAFYSRETGELTSYKEEKKSKDGTQLYYEKLETLGGKLYRYELKGSEVEEWITKEYEKVGVSKQNGDMITTVQNNAKGMAMHFRYSPDGKTLKQTHSHFWNGTAWIQSRTRWYDESGTAIEEHKFDDAGKIESCHKLVNGEMIEQDLKTHS